MRRWLRESMLNSLKMRKTVLGGKRTQKNCYTKDPQRLTHSMFDGNGGPSDHLVISRKNITKKCFECSENAMSSVSPSS